MIVRIVVIVVISILLMPLVFSEPDLCRNPKLDSIAFVSPDSLFFTSGGYYWYIKETDLPPGPPTDKLPDGFVRGDAAIYCDYLSVCGNASNVRHEQHIVLVENTAQGNRIIDFDIKKKTWLTSRKWHSDHMIGNSKIDSKKEIDAMFSVDNTNVFLVQNQSYAGVEWTECCGRGNYSKAFDSKESYGLMNSYQNIPIDAITVKGKQMYYFIGPSFWVANITTFSGGTITLFKGQSKNVSSQFFKYKECPEIPKPENVPQKPSDQNPDKGDEPSDPNAHKSEDIEPSTSGTTFLVVIIIVVVVVVALVIGIVVFVMRGKSKEAQEKDKKGVPAASRKPKVAAKAAKPVVSKVKPSKK